MELKLWVDDIRNAPDDTWNVARNVGAAIRAIEMFGSQITDINLDHDISHQVVVGRMSRPYPCEEIFETVARYMVVFKKAYPEFNPRVRIHTSNPSGLASMRDMLVAAGFSVEAQLARGANRLEMEL